MTHDEFEAARISLMLRLGAALLALAGLGAAVALMLPE
jgi:hypothetical protein